MNHTLKLIISGTTINIIGFIMAFVSLFVPWYSITFSGQIDGNKYDTKVLFGLLKYTCYYLSSNDQEILKSNEYYGYFQNGDCFPILPPTATLFPLGVVFIISIFCIALGCVPMFISCILNLCLFKKNIGLRNIFAKITFFIIPIISSIPFAVAIHTNCSVHSALQSYGADDHTSTSSDQMTEQIGDKLWTKSFYGKYDGSNLNIDDVYVDNSKWNPYAGFYLLIFSIVFSLISATILSFIKNVPLNASSSYTNI